jgi:ArsR family transcriptional regulator
MDPIQFYKCLADDTRLKSLLLIDLEQELCVCELMAALDESSQPKISRHLAQLRTSGLLLDRKQKQWVYYRINPALPAWCKQVISLSRAENQSFLLPHIAKLQLMGDRPQRINHCCI